MRTQYVSDEEKQLLRDVELWLEKNSQADIHLVEERFHCLEALGAAVFAYPSIQNTGFLQGIIRENECLADTLLTFSSPSYLLHIPTKVVALRSFLVAKFHAFSLLLYLVGEQNEFYSPLRNVIISVVCTLIAEDVYFSCLEYPGFARNTRASIANDLISLWDSGVDQRAVRYLSALSSLWIARDASPPSFGTMDGNSELIRISIDMDDEWRDFLVRESENDQARWALEEFLFGLSYEEIVQIRSRLQRYGVSAIGYEEIRSYLGSKPAYTLVNDRDPRAIYDFFISRREACALRKRLSVPGPLHTLEEIYLKYRIILELR